MAKRAGVKVNLAKDVYGWLRREQLSSGTSKTILSTAGIAALRALSGPEREAMVQWATLLDEGSVTWDEFEKACDETERERAKALARALERALKYELEEGPQRLPVTASEKARKQS